MSQKLKINTNHKQQTVKIPSSAELIQVDEKMAALLITMWSVGITTLNSCQGDTHLFVDQTCYEARVYRAYVQMKRDAWSMDFIRNLVSDYPAFMDDSCSWEISVSRNPRTEESRIVIRFPSNEIQTLTAAIESWA